MWLSLVERCVRDAEAGGSNPLTSTTKKELETVPFLWSRLRSSPRVFRMKTRSVQIFVRISNPAIVFEKTMRGRQQYFYEVKCCERGGAKAQNYESEGRQRAARTKDSL